MLVARGIVKSYGGVTALAGANLTLRPGQVHALLGENGAGKSTLVRIVTGLEQPGAGELRLDDRPVQWRTALAARAAGVATVSQELSLFPDLDVLSNLFSHGPLTRRGLVDRGAMIARARPHLAALGLNLDPRTPLGELSLAEQQLVEIARALIAGPSVLMLDEPTSALAAEATARLLGVVREIADRGVAVLYVSHYLQEVSVIADRVTVLRDGANAITDQQMSTLGIPDLVRAMLGTAQPEAEAIGAHPEPEAAPESQATPEPPARESEARTAGGSTVGGSTVGGSTVGGVGVERFALRMRGVSVPGVIEGVDLDVRTGEIVGLAGLEGAGHEAVLRVLWGLQPDAVGDVVLPRASGVPRTCRAALRAGVALIPSDRKRFGLMLDKPVWENITAVTALAAKPSGWRLRRPALRAVAQRWVDDLRIRCEIDDQGSALSGGNQQKVVFAKWLAVDPGLLLLDDPTRGVDVGAKREMHALIRGLVAQGRSVLICSTDLAELAELCDRVVLLRRGRVVHEAVHGRMSEGELLEAMNSVEQPA